jgi:broad specificity phosphatase PhoE
MSRLTRRGITLPLTLLLCALLAPAIGVRAAGPARATGTLRIYLARHGQTDWNAEGRMQGSTDVHLNATGREQAAKLAVRIKGLVFNRVYCSRLSRSRETAEIAHGSVPIDSLAGLNEQSVGRFQGLKLNGGDSLLTAEWEMRSKDPDDSLDGGESLNQFYERVRATVETIRKRHHSGNILIVGHGNTNRMVLRTLLGLTMEQALGIQQANDELYMIEIDPGIPPRLFKLITETTLKDL